MTRARISAAVASGVLALFLSSGLFGETPVESAIALYRKGDVGRACPMLTGLAPGRNDDALLHLYLLGCAIHGRDDAVVRRERDTVNRLVPRGARAYTMAGTWLAGAGYCGEAQDTFSRAAAGAPGAFEFHVARCYEARNDPAHAAEQFRGALARAPDNEEYALALAFLLMAAGDSDGAGKAFIAALERHPQSARILVGMSLLHLELGRPESARLGYEKARALAPDSAMVWKLCGRIETSEGAYADAVASFEQAAKLEPADAQVPFFMGMALLRIDGAADRALAAFERALELDPGLTEARFQAANLYFRSKEEYATAASLLEQVIKAAPGHVRARQLLVECYARLGRDADAAAQQEKVRELRSP